MPVIAAIRAAFPDTPISIDTTKPAVAEAAIDAGASLSTTSGASRRTTTMAGVAAAPGVPFVVMHNRAEARYDDVVAEVIADLRAALERADRGRGRRESTCIVDPGIGFGKTADHNVAPAARPRSAARRWAGRSCSGRRASRRSGAILDLPPSERVEATLATTALGIAAGVDIVRVHDVRANVRAARMSRRDRPRSLARRRPKEDQP